MPSGKLSVWNSPCAPGVMPFTPGRRDPGDPVSIGPGHETSQNRRASESAALAALVEGRVRTEADLAAAMDMLEGVPFSDVHAAVTPARIALELATELGATELVMRARLVQADVDRRLGNYLAAGRSVRDMLPWAETHGSTYLQARAHRILATFFRSLGDLTRALDHAVKSVRYLGENAPPRVRAQHTIGLATLLDETGSEEEAGRLFDHLLATADRLGDWSVALLVLNNTACTQIDRGNAEGALELIGQMRRIERQQGIRLDGMELDTIARVELLLGRPEDAERTLRPVVDDGDDVPLNEQASLPECLLTLVEAYRRQGAADLAQQTLDRARAFCVDHGLAGEATKVRLCQAELHADAGRYREAYEEHRAFHRDVDTLRSVQREQRAQLIEAMFQIEQAADDRSRLEQLAFRDTLTGLWNRRWVERELEDRLRRYASGPQALSIAMVDIDFFKSINDTFSHEIGDGVLVQIGAVLAAAVHGPASVGRLGGDEFIVVMPDLAEEAALDLADQLREAISAHDWQPLTGTRCVTASLGVTSAQGSRHTRSALLAQADRNLYRAKREGRNRVAGDPAPAELPPREPPSTPG
jgi:diguanylate cyclase (GGDEF)-like protein